ncbi:MAG: SLC13 family permease, partial [Gemmatimonadetes bacterium]|nr:SLC13 family permease [Gemmatimonadota bacterium]NIT68199.1 SLC13 family permease [Gemmatimonadota bacterium]NIV24825.1 SLC13 family permease [Gemmatimonadota bacterium]NIW76774.1 SLC13 family permease [Gemmatimonadota bacterium]NIY36776.1 SLC13 family permease [Gemmatimonadota bacterium]
VAVSVSSGTTLEAGDRLVLSCRPAGVAHARSIEGLDLGSGLETISAHEGAIVEGIIGPRSTIIGQTIRETHFRQRFRVVLIAIHR